MIGTLEGLAQLAAEQDPERAMRLLGAAISLREQQAGRPPPFLQRRAAAIRAQAEQHLTASVSQRTWDEGRQMTTDEAIAYALDGAGPTS